MISEANAGKVRYPIPHFPGSAWQKGVVFREQSGVIAHVQHNAAWFEAGKREMGGP